MNPDLLSVVVFSIGMATISTIVMLPPGIVLAWLLARGSLPGRTVVETLVSLPLVLPPVATGLILLRLFGRRGFIGESLAPFGCRRKWM